VPEWIFQDEGYSGAILTSEGGRSDLNGLSPIYHARLIV